MNTGEKTGGASPDHKMKAERVRNSSSYRGALAKANKILKKPEKLFQLVHDADAKAQKLSKGPIGETRDNLYSLFRLLKAYANGDYRSISWANLVLVVSAIIYFVTPFDLIPDFLLALGYFDDIAILSWTIKAIGDELDKFRGWEKNNRTRPPEPVEMADD